VALHQDMARARAMMDRAVFSVRYQSSVQGLNHPTEFKVYMCV